MAVKVFSPLREPAPASRPSLMRNDSHHPGSSARLCRSPAERRHPFLISQPFSRRGIAFSRVCRSDRISSVLMVSDIGGGINLAVHVNDVQYQTHAPPGRYAPLRIFARNLLPRPHPQKRPSNTRNINKRNSCRQNTLRNQNLSQAVHRIDRYSHAHARPMTNG